MRPTLLALLLTATPASAQLDDLLGGSGRPGANLNSFEDGAELTTAFDPPRAKPGQVVTMKVTIRPKPGCWTYPAAEDVKQTSRNKFRLPKTGDVVFSQMFADPTGGTTKVSDLGVDLVYKVDATWSFKAIVDPAAAPGKRTVTLAGSHLQVCNDSNCLPRTDPPAAELEILSGPPVPVAPEFASLLAAPAGPTKAAPKSADSEPAGGHVQKAAVSPQAHAAALDQLAGQIVNDVNTLPSNSLWAFLTTAAAWGLISLATPCVFPMIPITVSLFLKQGQQSPRQVLRLAAVYCLTIVAVLGVSAVALLSVFQKLSVDPYMNIFLGALFVFFALSLFGMFDITLPGFLLRFTEKRRGAGGLVGTVFGALAFSVVSFTCVAPFLGGFAGMAASGQFSQAELVAGGLTFAAAFAAPFFVLALFPSLLKKLPRSGGWLDTVKAVMGFLEVAAALKFFRTAELRLLPHTELFTYDVCLAGYVVVTAVCGLYLLNGFRLPHDDERTTVGVPRLMFALGFLGLSVYLLPGLFTTAAGRQRPAGQVFAWVDAFLLPEPAAAAAGGLPWESDLPAALARAAREPDGSDKRKVFVDFTGVTCANCNLNEQNVFPRPDVQELLRRYTPVKLYTDEVPAHFYRTPPADADRDAEGKANQRFQQKAFGTVQLPLYVILEPAADGNVRTVGVYDEGKINNVPKFVEFLRKPLEKK